jgi:hypothetical protein
MQAWKFQQELEVSESLHMTVASDMMTGVEVPTISEAGGRHVCS